MKSWSVRGAAVAMATLLGCATTSFVSSWKAPDAAPLRLSGAKVVAVVMDTTESSRRVAEDRLAQELTQRGAVGMPMYKILPDTSPESEAEARDALEGMDIAGVVVMRPIATEQELVVTPSYAGPRYGAYWGGYYGFGWMEPWGSVSDVRTNRVVWVETLIYSLRQNKLIWAGQSRTTNPDDVDALVAELSDKVAEELKEQGLLG
jgi:hypothetical protein